MALTDRPADESRVAVVQVVRTKALSSLDLACHWTLDLQVVEAHRTEGVAVHAEAALEGRPGGVEEPALSAAGRAGMVPDWSAGLLVTATDHDAQEVAGAVAALGTDACCPGGAGSADVADLAAVQGDRVDRRD